MNTLLEGLLFLLNAWVLMYAGISKAEITMIPSSLAQQARRNQANKKPKLEYYETKYFPQTLDHFTFTPESYRVFYQKYLLHSHFWIQGSPIFVYTGNEGDIEWFARNSGFGLVLAREFQAILVFIEHRFYGESKPFGEKSYDSPEKLGYLNSQQALADYAVLIRSLKHNLSCTACPVVVFGGSYGGMLAAWFRLKYPHIAIGALASSAPILHFDNIIPPTSFYDAVSQDFREVSRNCYEVIKGSWVEVESMWKEENGREKLSATFRSCRKLQHGYSASNWLESAFIYTAMVNYPTKATFMRSMPAYPVKKMCDVIDHLPTGMSKLRKAIEAASLYYNDSSVKHCFDIESFSDPHGLDGWDWQACTEMVMPMSCGSECMLQSFSYDFAKSTNYCMKQFGVAPRPHWITTEFGGNRIEQVLKKFGSNIIFSNGLQDPWSRGGVLKNISSTIVALVVEKGAHHTDLREPTKEDPKWLVDQRKQETNVIKGWIHDFYFNMKKY